MTSNETKLQIFDAALTVFAIIGIVALAIGGYGLLVHNTPSSPSVPTVTQQPVVEQTVAPTPVQTVAPAYPQLTNVVTISSLTTSSGQPQANIAEDGRTFFFQNWADYDNLQVGDRVQFTIVGTQNLYNGVQYTVGSVDIVSYDYDNSGYGFPIIYGPSVVSSSNDGYPVYPRYYYDPTTRTAWQWDGHRSDPISVKELRGQTVVRGLPPNRR